MLIDCILIPQFVLEHICAALLHSLFCLRQHGMTAVCISTLSSVGVQGQVMHTLLQMRSHFDPIFTAPSVSDVHCQYIMKTDNRSLLLLRLAQTWFKHTPWRIAK